MDAQALNALISRCLAVPDGEALPQHDAEALAAAAAEYPYAGLLSLLQLRHNPALSPEARAELMGALALTCPGRRTMAFANFGSAWADFYPEADAPVRPDTVDVIDTFLSTYGNCTPQEEALLERMIFNPAPDYAEILAREEAANLPAQPAPEADSHDALIDAFILSQHPATHTPSLIEPEETAPAETETAHVRPSAPAETGLLSESLAKIFIKQGRYERAYEIISGLNLKFPKKSAYFADQLRFLQKLIINRRHIEARNAPDATDK